LDLPRSGHKPAHKPVRGWATLGRTRLASRAINSRKMSEARKRGGSVPFRRYSGFPSMATNRATCNNSLLLNELNGSDASTIGPAPRPGHGRTWRTVTNLSARRVRGNACWPAANRLLYWPGAHREPEKQARERQGAGTRRRRMVARRDRRTSRPRPRSLPWKACGNPGLLFVLPSKWPVGVAVSAQLQTALA
jgi:hypothetical protein